MGRMKKLTRKQSLWMSIYGFLLVFFTLIGVMLIPAFSPSLRGNIIVLYVGILFSILGLYFYFKGCFQYAKCKNLNPILWLFIVIFLSWIGYLLLLFQPEGINRRRKKSNK